jgi:hypothetical protein
MTTPVPIGRIREKLNNRAYEHAKALINEGKFVVDERDAWSEHRPSAQQENEFIQRHGFAEYGKWYLGGLNALWTAA